jgi:hypothetical protein
VFIFNAETAALVFAGALPLVVVLETDVPEDEGVVIVVPKEVVLERVVVAGVVAVDLLLEELPEVELVLEEASEDTLDAALGPMLNSDVSAKTSLIFPTLTAWSVYPPPTGTMGRVSSNCSCSGWTLFAIAN